jgi:hypothetical protein
MATNAVCLFPALLKLFMKQWEGRKARLVALGLTVVAVLMQLASLALWPLLHRQAALHR